MRTGDYVRCCAPGCPCGGVVGRVTKVAPDGGAYWKEAREGSGIVFSSSNEVSVLLAEEALAELELVWEAL